MSICAPDEVRSVIESLQYEDGYPRKFQTPRETLERGAGHCLDAALAAAFLLEENFVPRLGTLFAENEMCRGIGHVIYIFNEETSHFGIGHSQYPSLRSRTTPFVSYDMLMQSYVNAATNMGYDAWHETSVHNIDELDLDWRNKAEDIVRMERFFRTGSTDRSILSHL